jgi:glyoxylase-like metal-dependent hydrolase (beta-lactamase superfamily II)
MRAPSGLKLEAFSLDLKGHLARPARLDERLGDTLLPAPARRRFLFGAGAVAFGALQQGCAVAGAKSTDRAVMLAPGVYMVPGSRGAADDHNLGRIGNAGFIVGAQGVVAIDTGTSYAHGQALLATIREVTPQPVRVALITHTRPEFLFGAPAFRERGIPVRMHSATARLMASRCEMCLKTLRQTLGDDAMRGTAMYKPDQEFDATHTLDLIGRPVRTLYFGHSSGPGDIAVLDERSGVLFAGGLLDAARVPDIQDGDLPGWHQALRELTAMKFAQVVPGHGEASSAALAGTVAHYLTQLELRARSLVTAGTSLLNVAEAADLPAFEGWDEYETIHRRNASIAFLRFEREMMLK